MTILKKKNLKIISMLVVTSLLFLFMNWKSYYITYIRNPNSLVAIMSCKWYEYILISAVYFLKILVLYILFFKITKYIASKISKHKYKHLTIFIIAYIEVVFLFEILFFYLNQRLAVFSFGVYINIGLYSIIFALSDYLFSKIYKNFNTVRVALLNASCNILAMISMQIFLGYFHCN